MSTATLPYQLVALDLDGTTIGADLQILPAVREAISAVLARGGHVTFATGRQFTAAVPFAQQLGLTAPLICYQGALVQAADSPTPLLHTTMPPTTAAAAVTSLLDAGIYLIAFIDEILHVPDRRPELGYYLQFHPEPTTVTIAPDLAATVAAHPTTKLMFIAEPAVVTTQLARLTQQFGEHLMITRSHETLGELTAPGISKGVALAYLAAHLGIPREATLAIGDQENDLSMLTWAGLGLAMGNAVPVVQEAAAATLPPVSAGGVAWGLHRYLLNPTAD